jgi:DNA replication protein DnaC
MTQMEQETAAPVSWRKLTHADLRRCNLGKVFWNAKADQIQSDTAREIVLRYCKNIAKMVNTGSGLLLSGAEGVGKTAAAACALKAALSAGFSSYFVTHAELKELRFEKVPSLYGSGADGITIKRYIENAKLLVLDGFNETFFEDKLFGPNQLEELVMRRSSEKLATIMTVRNFGALVDEEKNSALHDVITQCMYTVSITGRNMRDAARKKLADRIKGND